MIDHILRGLLREVPRDQHTEARRLIGLSHSELVPGRAAPRHIHPVEIWSIPTPTPYRRPASADPFSIGTALDAPSTFSSSWTLAPAKTASSRQGPSSARRARALP